MDEYGKRLTNSLLTWGFGLVLGVLFGLMVLGWWLWPVQWVDASPEDLLYQYQVDYLTTGIEAYGYTGDTATAQARYFALGSNAETALAEIVQNPGALPPLLLSEYSEQVAGIPVDTLALQPVEVPKTTTGLNPWVALIFGLLFIALGAVVTYLIFRGKEDEAADVEYIEYDAAPLEPMDATEPAFIETGYDEEVLEEQVEDDVLPAMDAGEEAGEEWYPIPEEYAAGEPEVDAEGMDLPPFIAAAGAAVVAGAAAAEFAEDEIEIEEASVEESLEEVEVEAFEEVEAIEESDEPAEDSSGVGLAEGAAMAGLAAAWLAEDESAEEELEQGEEVSAEIEVEEQIEAPDFGDLDDDEELEEETEAMVEDEIEEEEEIDDEPAPEGEELVNPHDPIEVKMRKKLQFVEGIGEVYSQKLAEAGIATTGKLMVEGVTRTGRQELAEKTGISEKLILKWLNEIDLYRIKGIGSEFADLLEAAGVDTVPELAQRNPENLYQALANTNQEKNLVRKLPTQDQVTEWVEQAKQLPRIIQY